MRNSRISALAPKPGSGRLRGLTVALLVTPALAFTASAQPVLTLPSPTSGLPFLPSVSGDWTIAIGGEGALQPDFEGAKHTMFSPTPIFSIHRAGSPDRFHSPRDGASIALVDFGGFRAGPVGKLKSARTAGSYSELNGLGDVKLAVEIGNQTFFGALDDVVGQALIER